MILSRKVMTKRSNVSEQSFEKRSGVTRNSVNDGERRNERGAAMIIALILIATFIFLATAASRTVSAISAEAQKIEQTRQEAARAEYYVSMAEATLKYDVRRLYNDYQTRGKQNELRLGGDGTLPMFDPLATVDSRPLLNLDGSHSGENPKTSTSLYGRISPWTEEAVVVSRMYLISKMEEKQISFPESVEIKSFTEAYRRTMQGESEPIYALRYTVRATSGEFAEIVREDTILLGPVLNEESPTVANCSDLELTGSANPANVTWGNSTRLDLNYVRAEKLVIYNQGGSVVYSQVVADEASPQSVSYVTNPLTAPAVFIGEAVRGTCQIQVPITVGVNFAQNIAYTVNGVQSVNINEGENVRYDWNVTDADPNFTTSFITFGNDPTHLFENIFSNSVTQPGPSVSVGSVLHVRDSRYNNGAEQTATINISVCRLPRVINFTVTPSTLTAGNANIRFDWQTEQAGLVRIIRISDGQIIYTSNNAASGSWTTVQPQETTEYKIEGVSDCGAPSAVATTRVTVDPAPPCPPPRVIFTVNPSSVTIGGNQIVTLTWNVTGTADHVSIDNGVGGSLPLAGSIQITQPQTTTVFTLTASGNCGSVQVQRTVQIEPTNGGENCNFDMNSEPICSVTNSTQCGPHKIQGQIVTNGNSFTFAQSHTPFGTFGQEYLTNVSFEVRDAGNRLITQGSWSYSASGNVYWNQQPTGAGTLYQNGVTINGILPPGVQAPLVATFVVGYGANAGGDSRTFNTLTSPGGCGTPSGNSCSLQNIALYTCEEHSNGQFSTEASVTIQPGPNNTTNISVNVPQTGYHIAQQGYSKGQFIVYGDNNTIIDNRNWSSDPQCQFQANCYYVPNSGAIQLSYPGTGHFVISGSYSYVVDTGDCTIIPGQNAFFFNADNANCVSSFGKPKLFQPDFDVFEYAELDIILPEKIYLKNKNCNS